MILNGTNVGNNKRTLTETDCEKQIFELIRKNPNYPIFIMTPLRHFERWSNIIQAAKIAGREVYVPLVVGYYIWALQEYRHLDDRIPSLDDVIIFLHPRGSGRYLESDYPKALRDFAFDPKIKKADLEGLKTALFSGKGPVIVLSSQTQLQYLNNFGLFAPGGIYIHSASTAFDEKGKVDFHQIQRIVRLNNYRFYLVHSSGHFSEPEFEAFLAGLPLSKIDLIIPLHTTNPKKIASMVERVSPRTKVLDSISRGQPYTLTGNRYSFVRPKNRPTKKIIT